MQCHSSYGYQERNRSVTFDMELHEQLNKAKKMMTAGEMDAAMLYVRQILETIVKNSCRRSGICLEENGAERNLIDLICALKEQAIYSAQEIASMHNIRMICNRSIHKGSGPSVSGTEAWDALRSIESLLQTYERICGSSHQNVSNEPMRNPDYYSTSRSGYGLWSRCYSREDLQAIPRYVDLKEKADRGDISAMLDLAVGFLPNKIVWGSNELVCMPMYRDQYNPDAYDARYYYWILKACDTCDDYTRAGRAYPKKYMATAFLEAAKFCLYCQSSVNLYISGSQWSSQSKTYQPVYSNQYQLVKQIYGEDLSTALDRMMVYLRMLLKLVHEANSTDIICSVHGETSIHRIQYLLYCASYFSHTLYKDTYSFYNLQKSELISDNDPLIPTQTQLKKYVFDRVNQRHCQFTIKCAREMDMPHRKGHLGYFLRAVDITSPSNQHTFIPEKFVFLFCLGAVIALCLAAPLFLMGLSGNHTNFAVELLKITSIYGWQWITYRDFRAEGIISCFVKFLIAFSLGWIVLGVRTIRLLRYLLDNPYKS